MTENPFKKAVKHEAKLRLAIAGPSGSGKTYTALTLAADLANGGRVAMVDTEHGSASKYADLFSFDTLALGPPYHPSRFVELIVQAAEAGYSVLVLDSLSHAWTGTGGLLEIVDQIAARLKTSNTFMAWKDATPIQNQLVEAILAAPLHVIGTMRSKAAYVVDQVDKGGRSYAVPRKIGMAPIQRDGLEYEFDVFLDMDVENNAIVSKTRCPALTGLVFNRPNSDLSSILIDWLGGSSPSASAPASLAPAAAPLVYENGTKVQSENWKEIKAFTAHQEVEGTIPSSRAALKRWAGPTPPAEVTEMQDQVDLAASRRRFDESHSAPSKEVSKEEVIDSKAVGAKDG